MPTLRSHPARLVLLLVLSGLSISCQRQDFSASDLSDHAVGGDTRPVARLDDSGLLLLDIQKPVQLQLYDLDIQRYRMLRGALEAEIISRLTERGSNLRTADIMLTPPLPPRLQVDADRARTRPAVDAPVTILVFCNFESPHCTKLQLQLGAVLPLYGDMVRLATRDFALPFHRHARLAAEASRCALDQGRYWQFYDLLFAANTTPDPVHIDRVARAAQLDIDRFNTCLENGSHREEVGADISLAMSLGIDSLPAVFVNGLYAGRNPVADHLIWLVEGELKHLGLESPRSIASTRETTGHLTLRGLLYSEQPGQGVALMARADAPRQIGVYREGDILGTNLTLRRVGRQRVELLNNGAYEWLGFGDASRAFAPDDQGLEEDTEAEIAPESKWPHRAVPVTLDRDVVLEKLADRPALEQLLENVPMTVDGYHLLRITDIPKGSLYELLGLEKGDVIAAVNERPVHEGENPLWYALQSESEVRLRVIRKGGLAQHYTYRFED